MGWFLAFSCQTVYCLLGQNPSHLCHILNLASHWKEYGKLAIRKVVLAFASFLLTLPAILILRPIFAVLHLLCFALLLVWIFFLHISVHIFLFPRMHHPTVSSVHLLYSVHNELQLVAIQISDCLNLIFSSCISVSISDKSWKEKTAFSIQHTIGLKLFSL